jgi:pimeloyl-ACP methyl ester carboxylesterase
MEHYRRDDLIFDVRDAGPPDGSVVVLLHGFPQSNDSWNAVIDRLTARGYRCLAPNQRGYSPGARPSRRRDYRMSELVADVGALIDASGARRVHLVGHDWGAAVAWAVAAEMPERLETVSPISVRIPLRSSSRSSPVVRAWRPGTCTSFSCRGSRNGCSCVVMEPWFPNYCGGAGKHRPRPNVMHRP